MGTRPWISPHHTGNRSSPQRRRPISMLSVGRRQRSAVCLPLIPVIVANWLFIRSGRTFIQRCRRRVLRLRPLESDTFNPRLCSKLFGDHSDAADSFRAAFKLRVKKSSSVGLAHIEGSEVPSLPKMEIARSTGQSLDSQIDAFRHVFAERLARR